LPSSSTPGPDVELSTEEQAELDRLADWPFLDDYPMIANP